MPNLATISIISTLFTDRAWSPNIMVPYKDQTVFGAFCELYDRLDDKEKALFLSLSEDFKWFTFKDYPVLADNVLKKIPDSLVTNVQNIVVAPLVTSNVKSKSANTLVYPIVNEFLPRIEKFRHIVPHGIDKIDFLNNDKSRLSNRLVIFVDDYIGSGNSAIKTLDIYNAKYKQSEDRLVFIALVAQEQGIHELQKRNQFIEAEVICKKGISDSLKYPNPNAEFALIDELELNLKQETIKKCNRGYKMSEALVAMIRTPNNTFPIYWCNEMESGESWPAPFPRL